jgi:hypothetical protein
MRGPLTAAGILKAESTGDLDPDTRRLLPQCLGSEACAAALTTGLAPRLDLVLKTLGQGS